jgi:RimJ/RimL family protein N-acetyltransferase
MKKFDWKELAGIERHYYSDRVILRPLMECDVYPIFIATTNPAFNRYLLWDAPDSVSQLSERIELILDERRKGQMGVWVAAEITTGAFVALFRAHEVERPSNDDQFVVETGIWLHPNYWLDGLSVEIGGLFMELLFAETPVSVIRAETHVDNRASKGLFRAVGLKHSGTLLVSHENGVMNPSEAFEISRQEYKIKGLSRGWYEDIRSTKEARLSNSESKKLAVQK